MKQKSRVRGVCASREGIKKLEDRKIERGWSRQKLANTAKLSIDTINRTIAGDTVDRESIQKITNALDLDLTDIIDPEQWMPMHKTPKPKQVSSNVFAPDWQGCCKTMLPVELTANPLLSGDGVMLTIEDIVPLGLVERKQRPQHEGDFGPEQGSLAYAPTEYEINRRFEHNKFFEQVLEKGDSPKSQGRRLAIVGESGVGKTTLLQQIANWVDLTGDLPIFVKLADLRGEKLKDYLLEDWLKLATRKPHTTPVIEDDFIDQFNAGRVWLLLDGIDEMAEPGNLLSKLAEQLKGWVAQARIVLTCRLNVWDANKNDLYSFDTYCMLQLSYPNNIGEFIRRFFSKADEPAKGEGLIAKLDQSPQRLRDLVKNPLRLILLCRTWKRRQGELPQTKAELYKRFKETFYEWKDKPEIPLEKRQQLDQALGELAKRAIEEETTKFRLRETIIREELDKFDKSLFGLACNFSWLNQVGMAAEDPDEAVYAFFHPTFQEYFAALAISDPNFYSDFFLPRDHEDKPVEDKGCPGEYKSYRIFKPQWKEVFLLWLGQENEKLRQQKEELIEALMNFEDGCKDFYRCQAYFLAAAGITEFLDFSRADEIVEQLVEWGFGSPLHIEQQEGQISFQLEELLSLSLTERASASLRETESTIVIKLLAERLDSIQNQEIYLRAIHNHKQIDTATQNTINFLAKKLLEQRTRVAYNLGKIDFGNQKAISALTDAIKALIEEIPTSREALSPYCVLGAGFCLLSAYMLLEISPSDPNAINTINHVTELLGVDLSQANITSIFPLLMSFSLTDSPRWQYGWNSVQSASSIGDNHQQNYISTEELVAKILLQTTLSDAPEIIVLTGATGQTSIADFLRTSKDKIGLCLTAFMLAFRAREICAGNSSIANALIHVLQNNQDSVVRLQVSHSLKAILTEQLLPTVVAALKDCLQDAVCKKDYDFYRHCDDLISYCARNMTYPDFYRAWNGELSRVEALKDKITDTVSRLQPTAQTYPIAINAQALEGETDISAIAQEILNQIFFAAFPNALEIPPVNNAAQLRSKIPQIKRQLQKQNLALILHQYEPYLELVSFCRQLASGNVFYIGWITNKPLEAPLRGFPSAQFNLDNILQNWLNDIG